MGKTMADDLSKYQKGGSASFDPKKVVDNMINSVRKESATSSQPVDEAFIQGLEELKDDPDFTNILNQFDESLKGNRNMMTVGTDLPELTEEENNYPTLDVGLNGLVLTGEESATENDLIRYSNYISGAGSTFGGTVAGLPGDIADLTTGTLGTLNYKYEVVKFNLEKLDNDLSKLRLENQERMVKYGITPAEYVRWQRTDMKDLRTAVLLDSYGNIDMLQGVTNEQKLLQLNQNTQNKLSTISKRKFSTRTVRRVLKRVGNGIEVLGTAFSFAQGGVDTAAGSDMIAKARDARKNNQISEAEYNEMLRNGRLRVAQGSFGIANGLKNVGEFVGKRVTAKISARLSTAGTKLLAQATRFGSFVGSAIAVGTGITSLTKNAIAAHDAVQSGNTGKAVMYGVMAAIDAVTVVLDGVSFVLDFVFPPLSFIIDLASTVLQVVNTILGFFADLIDFRSTEQIVKDDFDAYVNSDEFKLYIDNLASEYKDRGFDLFKFYVDAEQAGVKVDGATKETLRSVQKEISRTLTTRAENDVNNPTLRVALMDSTNTGRKLYGRMNNDEIRAGFGPDKIYGEGGDDYLFGRGGSDSIYGGPGNDYLNGGTGRDQLFGNEGDDWVLCEPGIDDVCQGNEGLDTLVLDSKFLLENRAGIDHLHFDSGSTLPITGVYLNLDTRKSGINLGSCFRGWPSGFNYELHKPAFRQIGTGSRRPPRYVIPGDFAQFLFGLSFSPIGDTDDLSRTVLWYLADVKEDRDVRTDSSNYGQYFTDGQSIYHAIDNRMQRVNRGIIQNLPGSTAERIKTLFDYAFNKGFSLDRFERIASQQPQDMSILDTYIPTIVVGNNDNSIDLSYGINDMAFTGSGNNVVSIGSVLNDCLESPTRHTPRVPGDPYNCSTWYKHVDGGDGQNTVVIQSSTIPGGQPKKNHGYWELRDYTKIPSNYNPHVVFMKNIQTVEVHARVGDNLPDTILVDARNYDGASRYIIDPQRGGEELVFYGPLGRDVTLLPKKLHFSPTDKNQYLLSEGQLHTLSFKFYNDEDHEIKSVILKPGDDSFIQTHSDPNNIKVTQVANVVGTSSIKIIWGNASPNMLYADGGKCLLVGDDGDDTLVSGRGIHELKGSLGTDTYVLQGPELTEYVTISIYKERDGRTIRCSTGKYGSWDGREFKINILKHDPNEIKLTHAEIVPDSEDGSKPQGTITVTGRELSFKPGSDFDWLEKNKAKTIRVMYKTSGSYADIFEEAQGNQLRLEGVSGFEELSASITADGLLLKKKDQKVFLDKKWASRINTDKYTSLDDLINDFATRFPLILFKQSDSKFNRAEAAHIITFLYRQLEFIVTQLEQNFDSYIDSTKLPSDVGDTINVGNGANVVLAKTKGKTYVLGEQSSGSIIFADQLTEGSGEIIVRGGKDEKSLNAVVVSPTSDTAVNVELQGPHDIIITGTPNDIKASKSGDEVNLKRREGDGGTFAKFNLGGNIRYVMFKTSNPKFDHVVMDVGIFAIELQASHGAVRFNTNPAWIGVTYTPEGLSKLHLPDFGSRNAVLVLEKGEMVWVYFGADFNRDTTSFRFPYLLIPGTIEGTLKAEVVVKAMKYQFKDGVQFSDREITSEEICTFLREVFTNNKVKFEGFEGTPTIDTNFKC